MPVDPLYKSPNAKFKIARSQNFDIDNGAGTTKDDCILRHSKPVKLLSARIVYTGATTGTVAAGTASIGTTVGGAEIVAATAYENSKAVGVKTAMTLITAAADVAADTPVLVRHTGVAATVAGEAYIELEYAVKDD